VEERIRLQSLSSRFYNQLTQISLKYVSLQPDIFVWQNADSTDFNIQSIRGLSPSVIKCNIHLDSYAQMLVTKKWYVFSCGGKDSPRGMLNFDFPLQKFIQKARMNKRREGHSILEFKENFLIITGGIDVLNSKKVLRCEVYSVTTNKWMVISKLREDKIFHCSFVVGKRIYVADGVAPAYFQVATSYLEKLELNDRLEGEWQEVSVKNVGAFPKEVWFSSYNFGDGKILLFGGRFRGEYTENCVIFDEGKCEIRKADVKLLKEDWFPQPLSLRQKNKMYYLSGSRNIHIFDGKEWSIISSGEIKTLSDGQMDDQSFACRIQ